MIVVVVSSNVDCWDDGSQCIFVGETLEVALSVMRCYDARYEEYPREVYYVRMELNTQAGMSKQVDAETNLPRKYFSAIHPTSEYYLREAKQATQE